MLELRPLNSAADPPPTVVPSMLPATVLDLRFKNKKFMWASFPRAAMLASEYARQVGYTATMFGPPAGSGKRRRDKGDFGDDDDDNGDELRPLLKRTRCDEREVLPSYLSARDGMHDKPAVCRICGKRVAKLWQHVENVHNDTHGECGRCRQPCARMMLRHHETPSCVAKGGTATWMIRKRGVIVAWGCRDTMPTWLRN